MTKRHVLLTKEKAALDDRLCILETGNVFLNERLAEFEIRVIDLERAVANRIACIEDKLFELKRRYEYVAYPWTTDAIGCDIKINR